MGFQQNVSHRTHTVFVFDFGAVGLLFSKALCLSSAPVSDHSGSSLTPHHFDRLMTSQTFLLQLSGSYCSGLINSFN